MNHPAETNGAKEDHNNISFTAYLVAHWRGLSDIPHAKEIAAALNAQEVTESVLGKEMAEKMSWFGAPMVESRNKALRNVLGGLECKNFLGIADGALPTGVIMTEDSSVKYVHTDLPGMLAEGESVLGNVMVKKGIYRPNLKFMPVDATNPEQLRNAVYFFEGQPFVSSCEGFLMYLDNSERKAVMQSKHDLLKTNNGIAWATTDIFYRTGVKSLMETHGPEYAATLRKCLEMINQKTGRSMRDNFFENPEEAHRTIEETGFDWQRFPVYNESVELASLKHIPENMIQGTKDWLSQRYVYVMRPKKA